MAALPPIARSADVVRLTVLQATADPGFPAKLESVEGTLRAAFGWEGCRILDREKVTIPSEGDATIRSDTGAILGLQILEKQKRHYLMRLQPVLNNTSASPIEARLALRSPLLIHVSPAICWIIQVE